MEEAKEGSSWAEEVGLPQVSAITIMIDGGPPRVNLGDVSPYMAIVTFQQLIDMLQSVLQEPEVIIDGEDIYDMMLLNVFGEDVDDED